MKKTMLAVAACLLAPSLALAENSASAGLGGRWLNILNNPRSAGMGGAGGALAKGPGSMGSNPAGLLGQALELETSHLAWDEDLSLQRLAIGIPFGPEQGKALGLHLDYVNMGSVEAYTVNNGLPVASGTLHPYGAVLGAAYAQRLPGGLTAGLEGKAVLQELGAGQASTWAGDFGLGWSQGPQGLALGLAVLNAGGALDSARLPTKGRLSAAWTQPLRPGSNLKGAVDLLASPETDEAMVLALGAEYSVSSVAEFRAGYVLAQELGASGPSAGLSLGLGRWLSADYAFNLLGGQAANQLGLRASWGGSGSASEPAQTEAPAPLAPVATVPMALSPSVQTPAASPDLPAQVASNIDKLITAVEAKDAAASQALTESMVSLAPAVKAQLAETVKADGVAPSVFEGEFQRAEAYLRTMTRLQRDNAYAWMALGTVLWFQAREAEALECYQRSYLLDPSQDFLATRIKQMGGTLPAP